LILHEPEISRSDGRVRVHARIETAHPKLAALERLWFELDADRGLELSDRADAFVAAMLPIAMACGESLEVRGTTSPRLAWGVRELQRVHFAWWPQAVKIVDVRYARLAEPAASERGAGVATAFSGGVDSFYSLWSHTGEREPIPEYRLSHALLVNGFDLDVDLEETGRFATLRAIYAPLLASLGVALVTPRTNLRAFRQAGVKQRGLVRSFGTALIAPALALQRALGRFYLPAARGYQQFEADGSNPSTDHLLGTEAFQTIHDGADAPSRFAKTAVLASWPEALAQLRVCSNPAWRSVDAERGVIDNCGACKKCVWTLTSLELVTGRKTFPSFPRPVARADRRWAARTSPMRAPENLDEAVARGRRDIALDIRCGVAQGRLARWLPAVVGHRRQRRARVVANALRADSPSAGPQSR
jgi:hypothetical protein